MKKILLCCLLFISIVLLVFRFGSQPLKQLLGNPEKSGIRVLTTPSKAKVFINDELKGETPFEDTELLPQEYIIKLQSGEAIWQRKVKLNTGTVTIINRELSKDLTSPTGEILILEKGQGVTFLSTPSGAEVEIDGKVIGKTPGNFQAGPGEHIFNIASNNYLRRSVKASIPDKYNLIINVDLAVTEVDLTPTFVTEEATKLIVKNTPTGFLRVRDKASLNGKEVARVTPGEELILLEEAVSWDKVRLSNGVEGYVSTSYVEKKTTP